MMTKNIVLSLAMLVLISCKAMKQKADLIIYNARIQTVDDKLSLVQAMAVGNGRILATGSNEYIFQHYQTDNRKDLGGRYMYPGFIDAHSHFYGYALTEKAMADLKGTRSLEEVVHTVDQYHQEHPSSWIVGRGWDQNKWDHPAMPDKKMIDSKFPDTPVVLIRIDGHVVLVNEAAIRQLGLTPQGIKNKKEAIIENGMFTGIFFESLADRFKDAVPKPGEGEMIRFLQDAEMDCFSVGLTTVADAGLPKKRIMLIDSLQKKRLLSIRIYAMLDPSEENLDYFIKKGVYQTDKLNVRSVKLYADGALGSRGACLAKPYADAPETYGIMMSTPDNVRKWCSHALAKDYQVNIHCIGDSANKMILNIYGEFLKGKNDRRWRIEHAQLVDPGDLDLFGRFNIIPSIQTVHATSDMYWAGNRLGAERIKYAYAYKDLLGQNGWIANGTDFPIEKKDPLLNFYAAVARRDVQGKPEGGFNIENALTREQALRSLTIWAARACMEERIKGSLETGKYADFIVLDEDLMTVPLQNIPGITVKETYLEGRSVFQSAN